MDVRICTVHDVVVYPEEEGCGECPYPGTQFLVPEDECHVVDGFSLMQHYEDR